MGDKKVSKIFNDSVHGHIEMPPLLVKIIDTPEFQRLRNIKQLGGGYYVFPGASHNRFEHSLGVAHLAGQLVKSLNANSKLNIDSKDELCVQIAGLCHDLGHGPFSHVFEVFMKEVDPNWKHEKQSVKMFEHLIGKPQIKEEMRKEGLQEEHFSLIANLINPSDDKITQAKYYLHEIVANPRTGIDVDKMDYFIRDCHHLGMKCNFSHERYMKFTRICKEKQICVRDKEAMNMYELFHTRNLLHHNVYQHRVKKAVEIMIVDALKNADEILQISAKAGDIQTYVTLTDDILQQILQYKDPALATAQRIIERIFRHDFYTFIGGKIFEPEEVKHLDSAEKQQKKLSDWFGKFKAEAAQKNLTLNAEDFVVAPVKLNYGMKEKNPIDALQFYKKGDLDKPIDLSKDEVSYLLPQQFSETKVMVFYKGDDDDVAKLASEHIEQFWQDLAEDPISAAVNNSNTYVHLTDGVLKVILRLQEIQQQVQTTIEEEITKRSSGMKKIAEKTFKRQELNHLDKDKKWKEKLKAWLNNVPAGAQQPAPTAEDFKVVSYPLLGDSDSIHIMLFYKGKAKVKAETFWEEVQKVSGH